MPFISPDHGTIIRIPIFCPICRLFFRLAKYNNFRTILKRMSSDKFNILRNIYRYKIITVGKCTISYVNNVFRYDYFSNRITSIK